MDVLILSTVPDAQVMTMTKGMNGKCTMTPARKLGLKSTLNPQKPNSDLSTSCKRTFDSYVPVTSYDLRTSFGRSTEVRLSRRDTYSGRYEEVPLVHGVSLRMKSISRAKSQSQARNARWSNYST